MPSDDQTIEVPVVLPIDGVLVENGTHTQFNGSYLNLPEGFQIPHLQKDATYTIRTKFAKGGEGQSYIATDQNGNIKVVKIKELGESKQFTDFEQKVSVEFAQINEKLGTNYQVFAINGHDLAAQYLVTVADFIEGRNVKEELKTRNAIFSESEVIDVLLQLAENYLKPLHEAGIVHRDIKPENIIVSVLDSAVQSDASRVANSKKYSLIDFGSIRQHDQLATLTGSFVGTIGYSKIKGKYETTDDFYSLARTAYFLFTAKDPEFVAISEYDQMADDKRFKALSIDDELKTVLLKMLAHDRSEKYDSVTEVITDLKKIETRINNSIGNESEEPIVTLDVQSAQKLVLYRELSQPPMALLQKIEGVKTLFIEQYNGCKADRNPLSSEFIADLDIALRGLGYVKKEFFIESSHTEKNAIVSYVRMRKDSESIDVLHLKNVTLIVGENNVGNHIDDYFDYFEVHKSFEIERLCKAAYYNESSRKKLFDPDSVKNSAKGILSGVAIGGTIALVATALLSLVSYHNAMPGPIESLSLYLDILKTGLKYSLPIVGGIGGLIGFGVSQSSLTKIDQYNDLQSLEAALKPAAKFLYDSSRLLE